MARDLHDNLAHALVFIKIVLGKTQFPVVEEILQGPTVSAKMPGVDEEIRPAFLRMVKNHGLDMFLCLSPSPIMPCPSMALRGCSWVG